MTHLDSLHESLLYLLLDSYRLWLIVVIISNRLLYIRGLSLADSSPVWPHFYTVPLAQIHLCLLPYIHSLRLKNSLVLFVYWISLPSTKHECKLENAVTTMMSRTHWNYYWKMDPIPWGRISRIGSWKNTATEIFYFTKTRTIFQMIWICSRT